MSGGKIEIKDVIRKVYKKYILHKISVIFSYRHFHTSQNEEVNEVTEKMCYKCEER